MATESLGSRKFSKMVSLAGEQPMPNILTALHFRPREMTLLASDHPRVLQVSQQTAIVLGECGIETRIKSGAPAYDFAAMKQLCAGILRSGRDFVVNLTGGTKLQALGAYSAASAVGVPAAYLDFRDKRIHLFQNQLSIDVPIGEGVFEQIDVRRSLVAHGVEPGREERHKNLRQLFERATYLGDHVREVHWMGVKLRGAWYSRSWSDMSVRGRASEVLKRLLDWNYLEGRIGGRRAIVRFTEAGRHFIGGAWLEYFAASKLSPLAPDDLAFRVPIRVVLGDREIQTELDVAVTIRARLSVVSCKTAALRSRSDPDSYVDHLDELRALSPILGGTFGRSVLVTSESFAKREANRVLDRAAIYGIPILDRASFPELAERFRLVLG